MEKFDLAVIGSGPGGYVAAIRAAQRGLNTLIIEKEHIGGLCLNWGCIPTKAIIRSVNILRDIRFADEFGIEVDGFRADMPKIIARSRAVADRLTKGIAFLLKKHGITVMEGHARLEGNSRLDIEKNDQHHESIEAKHIIIATGARSKALPHIPIDGKSVITSREALELDKLPGSMAIMGAGAIGIEFAYIYKHLGVDVTIIEALDSLLPNEDADISQELYKQFKKQKIKALVSTKVMKMEKGVEDITLTLEGPKGESELKVDVLLSAVGVTPNTEDLGLEKAGVKTERGSILVNEYQETNVKGIYAIGDVAGAPCLAHKASKEALIAIDHIQGKEVKALNKDHIPGCTYCEPQIASVGLREQDALEMDMDYEVSKVYYRAIGKAVASGHIDGFMKFVVDRETKKILGAHCIGAEATELIAELTLALSQGMTVHELAETIHAHPTLSELIMETAENALGEAIHV
ncbi:MAG: dihydrolipoyl dehydrogenase [Candidatus Marinimicrobia bacterium]|nr:dihydrolipoyl dehydrogenase [Candidatus Neomarinimicrobiota bacterium]